MNFSLAETAACGLLVEMALEEDLGAAGDVTSRAIIPPDWTGRAAFIARSAGVLAGLPAVGSVFAAVDANLTLQPLHEDGARLEPGQRIAIGVGPLGSLLTAERTALNFLQRLSGIATMTRRYVDAVAGLPVKILDTRKTTPGWRLLEKYAVRCGGGQNHRLGLYDGVLIKDNHLAALGGGPEALELAVYRTRQELKHPMILEVEVDAIDQLQAALARLPNIVLLDNMTLDQLQDAVQLRNLVAPGVNLEASGGVTLETVRAIAETGVDRISVGALTHSAPALDIALDYLK